MSVREEGGGVDTQQLRNENTGSIQITSELFSGSVHQMVLSVSGTRMNKNRKPPWQW